MFNFSKGFFSFLILLGAFSKTLLYANAQEVHLSQRIGMDVLATQNSDLPFITEATRRGGVNYGSFALRIVSSNNAHQNNQKLKINSAITISKGIVGAIPGFGSPANAIVDISRDSYDTALANYGGYTAGLLENDAVTKEYIDSLLPQRNFRLEPLFQEKLEEAKQENPLVGLDIKLDAEATAELRLLREYVSNRIIPEEVLLEYEKNPEQGAQATYDKFRNELILSLESAKNGTWDKEYSLTMIHDEDNEILMSMRNNPPIIPWENLAKLEDSSDSSNPAKLAINTAIRKVDEKFQDAKNAGKSEQELQILKLQLQNLLTSELAQVEEKIKKHYQKEVAKLRKALITQKPKLNFVEKNLRNPQYAGGRQLWSAQSDEFAAVGREIEVVGQLYRLLGLDNERTSKVTNTLYATLHVSDGVMAIMQSLALKKEQNKEFEEISSSFVGGLGGVLSGINLFITLSQGPVEDPVIKMLESIMAQLNQVMANQELLALGQHEIRRDISQLERVTMYQFELLRNAVAELKNTVDQRNGQVIRHISENTARLENILVSIQEDVRLAPQRDYVQELNLQMIALQQINKQNSTITERNSKAADVTNALRNLTNLMALDDGPKHNKNLILHSNKLEDIETADQFAHSVYQQYIARLLPKTCNISSKLCSQLSVKHTRQLVTDLVQGLINTATLMDREGLRSDVFQVQYQEALQSTITVLNSYQKNSLSARELAPIALENYRLLLQQLRDKILTLSQITAQAQVDPLGSTIINPVVVFPKEGKKLAGKLKDYRIKWQHEGEIYYGVERNKLQSLLSLKSTDQFTQPSLNEYALKLLLKKDNNYKPLDIELQKFAAFLYRFIDPSAENIEVYSDVSEQVERAHHLFKERSKNPKIFSEHHTNYLKAFNQVISWTTGITTDKGWLALERFLNLYPPNEQELSLADALRSSQLNSSEQGILISEFSNTQHQDMMIAANVAEREQNTDWMHTGERGNLPSLKFRYSSGNSSTFHNLKFFYIAGIFADSIIKLKPGSAKNMMDGRNATLVDELAKDSFLQNVTSLKNPRSLLQYGTYILDKNNNYLDRRSWTLQGWHSGVAWSMYDIIPTTNPEFFDHKSFSGFMPVKEPKLIAKEELGAKSFLQILPNRLKRRSGGVRRLFDGVIEARKRLERAEGIEPIIALETMRYAKENFLTLWKNKSAGESVKPLLYVSEKHRKAAMKATDKIPELLLSISKARLGLQKLFEIGYGNDCIRNIGRIQNLYRVIYNGVRGSDWKIIDLRRNVGDTHPNVLVAAQNLDMSLAILSQKKLLLTETELHTKCQPGHGQTISQLKLMKWLQDWQSNGSNVAVLTHKNLAAALR